MPREEFASPFHRTPGYERAMAASARREVPRSAANKFGGALRTEIATGNTLPGNHAKAISEILEAIGKPWFYAVLAARMASMLGCSRYLAMRYSKFAKPAFLVNSFIQGSVEDFYLSNLYLLDPLYKMACEGRECSVSTLRGAQNEDEHAEYRETLFHRASILDELALVLPMFGGAFIAICLDKEPEAGTFDSRSIDAALELYPIVKQANILHLERSLPGRGFGLFEGTATAVLVTTADHQLICKNEAWSSTERSALSEELERIMTLGCIGRKVRLGEGVVHGHRLGVDNPIWSNGNIFFIESQSDGIPKVDLDDTLDALMRRYRLSPRERDLVTMALCGCGTRTIAEQLGLSIGTIKNYKLRLYAKLGIRSEREMASLLFGLLGGTGKAV